jgi:hypothetical protein
LQFGRQALTLSPATLQALHEFQQHKAGLGPRSPWSGRGSLTARAGLMGSKPAGSGSTRFLRTLCRALQDYGMIVLDGSSDRVLLLEMEDEATAGWSKILGPAKSNSYSHIIRDQSSPDDGLSRNAGSGIPWNRMRVVARGE